jgi:hypothetical protein
MKLSEFIEELNKLIEDGEATPDMDVMLDFRDSYGDYRLETADIEVRHVSNEHDGKPFVKIY